MSAPIDDFAYDLRRRQRAGAVFKWLLLACTLVGIVLLAVLLYRVVDKGIGWLDGQFLDSFHSRHPEEAGIKAGLYGTLWLISLTALFSIPIGIGAAIYLEEFSRKNRLSTFIELNIANLAGVPSIVYGMLGLAVFVRYLSMGSSVLAGACIMTLLILPVIIVAAREALKAVPDSLRQGAMAVGATRWQMVRAHLLPAALPSMLTGVILALSRAIGETAPLIVLGALTYVAFVPELTFYDHGILPDGLFEPFTALPIQIFNWASLPKEDYRVHLAAAGILVLLAVLLSMNAVAVILRNHYRKKRKW